VISHSARDLLKARLERADGSEASRPRLLRDKRLILYVTEPARYVVRIPDIDGCEPIAPFNVDVRAGEMTEQTVKLVRRK
jgi:hypothetical protein